jgi:hypothetical protein
VGSAIHVPRRQQRWLRGRGSFRHGGSIDRAVRTARGQTAGLNRLSAHSQHHRNGLSHLLNLGPEQNTWRREPMPRRVNSGSRPQHRWVHMVCQQAWCLGHPAAWLTSPSSRRRTSCRDLSRCRPTAWRKLAVASSNTRASSMSPSSSMLFLLSNRPIEPPGPHP